MSKKESWLCSRKVSNPTRTSLFRSIPFTQIHAAIVGAPLSKPWSQWHVIWSVAILLARLWVTWIFLEYNIKRNKSIETLNDLAFFFLAHVTYILILLKKNLIIDFLASEGSSAPKLRKIDLLGPLVYGVIIVITIIPAIGSKNAMDRFKRLFLSSIPDSFCTLSNILVFTLQILYKLWFQLAPICAVIYALGYQVLYYYKVNVLKSISSNLNSLTLNGFLAKLKQVIHKQKQFESIFGPFILYCVCYNFFVNVYIFIHIQRLVSQEREIDFSNFSLYYIAYSVLVEAMSIGLIICISRCNEKIQSLSSDISDLIEVKLSKDLACNFLLVKYLQKKMHTSFNRPLTAHKIVDINKRVVLTTTASCFSFAVLLIQINNGALISK